MGIKFYSTWELAENDKPTVVTDDNGKKKSKRRKSNPVFRYFLIKPEDVQTRHLDCEGIDVMSVARFKHRPDAHEWCVVKDYDPDWITVNGDDEYVVWAPV